MTAAASETAKTPRASQTRQLFIRLAQKRQKPGSGSSAAFLRERTARLIFPDVSGVLSVPWATVGAAATRLYMPERMTQDFDILVTEADVGTARKELQNAGFTYTGELTIGGSSWLAPQNGFPLDVLEGREVWCESAIKEAQTNRDGQNLPILPLPYLVLMKFAASRSQDIGDLTRMLGQAAPADLDRVRQIFARYAAEGDREDLESLILLGQLENAV